MATKHPLWSRVVLALCAIFCPRLLARVLREVKAEHG